MVVKIHAKDVVEVRLYFWDIFGIEKIIKNKIVFSGFLSYNINIGLLFGIQNFSKIKIINFLFMKSSISKKNYFLN